ncbi:MAG: carotenoid 1,2-hydratase [Allorhizobium sp.]
MFSPYYHWSGRHQPEDHVAFNIALYTPTGDFWAMTERGRANLSRDAERLAIGESTMEMRDGKLLIRFAETALCWPGQRLWPKAISGTIEITPAIVCNDLFFLDGKGHHVWSPRMPSATASIACEALPGGGWHGRAYHDTNFGDRPIEQDFIGWDWARGSAGPDGDTVIFYDALLRTGERRRLGLRTDGQGGLQTVDMPERREMPKAFWGVRGGIACEDAGSPKILRRLEDSPFYTRSLVETVMSGKPLTMVHETLDCIRLSNPLVRLMLPFRMPRRARR